MKTNKTTSDKLRIDHASVDRIDPNIGYLKGNIRFISVMANFALNNQFVDEDLFELCKLVMKNNKKYKEEFL